ncbi:MAG: cobalt ECF transporter T component CbiQ [Desulfovibrionaceae bacterium]
MIEERFAQGNSPLHRADARCKLAAAGALAMVLALTGSWRAAALGVVLGLGLTALARLPLRAVLGRLAAVNGFIVFLWLVVPPTYGGEAAFHLGPVPVSRAGLAVAGLATLKCNAILLCFLSLVATSPVPALGRALQGLGVPRKLGFILLFTYRYLFVIAQEYQRLLRAARLRCFTPRTNLHTYRTYANLFGMTLVRSVNRSRRVAQAMTLRGFDGVFRSLAVDAPGRADAALLAGLLAAAAGLAALGLVW